MLPKFRCALFSLFLTITVLPSIYGQTETPSGSKVTDSRENGLITDPKKVTSAVNPAARAVPLDDLYFSRNVSNPAWSPDGKEIVPEEGHGFVKRENQIDSIKRTLEWFDRHLKKSKF